MAIVNNAPMNMRVHIFFELVFQDSLDIFPEMKSLGQKVIPFLILRKLHAVPTVAAPACIPTNSALRFPFLHNLARTCLLIYGWQPFWQL